MRAVAGSELGVQVTSDEAPCVVLVTRIHFVGLCWCKCVNELLAQLQGACKADTQLSHGWVGHPANQVTRKCGRACSSATSTVVAGSCTVPALGSMGVESVYNSSSAARCQTHQCQPAAASRRQNSTALGGQVCLITHKLARTAELRSQPNKIEGRMLLGQVLSTTPGTW